MDTQRHVIKRQVLELPLSSSSELQLREQQFKQIYYQRLLPVIEKFFNQFAELDFHYQLDRVYLEIEDFDWDNLQDYYHLVSQLERQLRIQVGKQITEQTKSMQSHLVSQLEQQLRIQVDKQIIEQTKSMQSHLVSQSERQLRIEVDKQIAEQTKSMQSAVARLQSSRKAASAQILAHFLQTGTLPWWAEELNRQQLDNWLQQVLQQEIEVISLLRQAMMEPRSRKRCIVQFSDTSLWHICQKLLPFIQLAQEDSIPFNKNDVNYREIARCLGLDAMRFRVQHWDIILGLSMVNEQQSLTSAAFIKKYWYRLSIANDSQLKDWRINLDKAKLLTAEQSEALAAIATSFTSSNDELSKCLTELAKSQQLTIEDEDFSKDFAERSMRLEELKDWQINSINTELLTNEQSKTKLSTFEQGELLADISTPFTSSDDEVSIWLTELTKLQRLAIVDKDFSTRLVRLEKIKPKGFSLQQWQVLEQQFSLLKQKLLDYQEAVEAKRIANLTTEQLKSELLILMQECQLYLLNFEQNLTRFESQVNTLQQLMMRLQHIYKLSPPSNSFFEVLQQLGTDLSTVFKPYLDDAIVQRCLSLLEYAKVHLLTSASDYELLKYTQEFYGLIDKELVKLQPMLDFARQNLMEMHPQLLPYQKFYQSLQTLLVSVEQEHMPLDDSLVTELKQTTRTLAATNLRLQGLSLLEKLGQHQTKSNNTATITSDIRNILAKLIKRASLVQNKNKTIDAFSDVDEIFVNNAGFVILWPYLGRFFTGIGLLKDGRFRDQEAAERAAVLCHYLVAPNEQPSEPSLALNKLLCGLELAEPILLEIALTESEQKAIDELLSAVAGNWAALKTTNPNALRQLFLRRNGSLQIKDGNYLVRVERKSHDILLDKLPWSIANIKLAWLEPLIRVEW